MTSRATRLGPALLIALGWLWGASPAPCDEALAPSSGYVIDTWHTDSGLPDMSVTGIAQTPDGYLWCATKNGLARFDGVRFKSFGLQHDGELVSRRISQVFVDRRGTLWISSVEGALVQFKEGRFTSFHRTPGERPLKGFIGFADDAQGRLWLTTEDSEVVCFADGQFTAASAGWHKPGPIPCQVRNDYRGHPWISSTRGLARMEQGRPSPVLECDPGQYEFHCPSHAGGWWISVDGELRRWSEGHWAEQAGQVAWADRSLQHALEDRDGQLWFASKGNGVFLYKTNGAVHQFTVKEGLGSDFARCLFEDFEGNLWVGLESGGLSRLRRAVFQVYGREQGLSSDLVTSVSEGSEGELWVATDGDGLNRLQDGAVLTYGPEEGIPNRHVQCVFADRKGNVWAGTTGWGLQLLEMEGDRFVSVGDYAPRSLMLYALFEDARGCLWLGQETPNQLVGLGADGVQTLRLPNAAPTVDIRVIAEDAAGNLCVGTDGSGCFVRRGQTWRHYTRQSGLGSDIVWSIHPEGDGGFWLGTFGGGLTLVKNDRLVTCTEKDGLVNDFICHIADDERGNLWFSSYHGVFRAAKADLNGFAEGRRRRIQCVAYGTSDGLPTLQCSGGRQPAGCQSRDGRLWFPTIKGLAVVDPAAIARATNPKPPPVHIEEVYVDGELQAVPSAAAAVSGLSLEQDQESGARRTKASPPLETLQIGPGHRRLAFHYTGLSFRAPENMQFKYRLEGLDEEWVEAGPSRLAAYAHVPPGRYVFRVIASNSDGVWNDTGASFGVVLRPYFWQTWWFRVIVPMALLGSVAWGIRVHEKRKMQQRMETLRQQNVIQQERTRIAQDMHDDLGAQLTRISFLSETAKCDLSEPSEVEREIDQIADTARGLIRSLDEIVWAVNPKNDTLENLLNYLYRYTVQYFEDTQIQCRFDIPTAVPDCRVSGDLRHNLFLGVKEALNNVLKYSGGTEVQMRIQLLDSRVEVLVSDNGRGFETGARPRSGARGHRVGEGLGNMGQRLQSVGGRCDITSAPGQGTTVTFTLSLAPGRMKP